jgi:hypothetical protein
MNGTEWDWGFKIRAVVTLWYLGLHCENVGIMNWGEDRASV